MLWATVILSLAQLFVRLGGVARLQTQQHLAWTYFIGNQSNPFFYLCAVQRGLIIVF